MRDFLNEMQMRIPMHGKTSSVTDALINKWVQGEDDTRYMIRLLSETHHRSFISTGISSCPWMLPGPGFGQTRRIIPVMLRMVVSILKSYIRNPLLHTHPYFVQLVSDELCLHVTHNPRIQTQDIQHPEET